MPFAINKKLKLVSPNYYNRGMQTKRFNLPQSIRTFHRCLGFTALTWAFGVLLSLDML